MAGKEDEGGMYYAILYKSPKGYTGTAYFMYGKKRKIVILPARRKNMWNIFYEVTKNPLERVGTAFLNFDSKEKVRFGNDLVTYLGTAKVEGEDYMVIKDKRGRIWII